MNQVVRDIALSQVTQLAYKHTYVHTKRDTSIEQAKRDAAMNEAELDLVVMEEDETLLSMKRRA